MRGYRVGWTKGVQFEKDGVLVRVDIKKKFNIPSDSIFEINTLNFMGEKAITINPGKSKKYLTPGARVKGTNRDLMIQAKEIMDTIKGKIDKGGFESKMGKISKSIDLLYSALNKINTKLDKVNISKYNKQIEKIGTAADNLSEFLKESKKELQLTTKKGRESFEKMDKLINSLTSLTNKLDLISDKINKGKGSAGKFLNDKKYIENLNETIEELKKLIADFKKHPKKYVKLSLF
jgi:phospholipid/cholesterol/gamma-HCH transport system substrate-binding protein